MKRERAPVGRRQFLRTLGVSTAALAAGGPLASETRADTETQSEKTRARYKAGSPEVQTFYRVNRYPTSN